MIAQYCIYFQNQKEIRNFESTLDMYDEKTITCQSFGPMLNILWPVQLEEFFLTNLADCAIIAQHSGMETGSK